MNEYRMKGTKMAITAASVKELRERTGSGMMAFDKALVEAGGWVEFADSRY